MTYKIFPGSLSGTITPPPSKSYLHRAAICAALAKGTSKIIADGDCDDAALTRKALARLGAVFAKEKDGWQVTGILNAPPAAQIDCGESGSTLRFLLPVAASLGVRCVFTCSGRLPQRPIAPLRQALCRHGISFSGAEESFEISGKLLGGDFSLPGDVSSQFFSGLLFSFVCLEEACTLRSVSPLQSAGYLQMSIDTMAAFGVSVRCDNPGVFSLSGKEQFSPTKYTVEADYSAAAFFLAAAALGHTVLVRGLNPQSLQGDRALLNLFERWGATPLWDENILQIKKGSFSCCEIDARPIPDLIPILMVAAAVAGEKTSFVHLDRVRLKESDRVDAMVKNLRALGCRAEESENTVEIFGGKRLCGGKVNSFGDHRIAMAMAIAALDADGPVELLGGESVTKSYPAFWNDFLKLGGKYHVL